MNSWLDQIQLHFNQGLIFHKNGPIFSESGVQLILQVVYSITFTYPPNFVSICLWSESFVTRHS